MRARVAFAFFFIIIVFVARPEAQAPAAMRFSPAPAATAAPAPTMIDLFVGRSTVLNVGATIHRVSLTIPDVADALVTGPQQILIHGKAPGTISLFVWDKAGGIKTYEVNVRRDLDILKEQVASLFPGENISVAGSGTDVVLSGTVSNKYVIDKAAEVAGGFVEKKENVVNLLKQQEGIATNQVLLRVRFAEVSRSAMQELGASFILNGKNDWFGRTTTQQFAAPNFDSDRPGGLTFSDFLNVFVFNTRHQIGSVIKALQEKGLFQSLAEPNLIASHGKEASFLAGGEFPYPVAQVGSGTTSVTIQFKEFGIRLSFTPTVLGGDLINLKVKPEVSALDFANGVSLQGFRVPALSTRRTETEIELQDGQTFAIAGLLSNTVSSTMSKIPGIGDIPILGYLFRSRAYQKQQTELVVMITPQIVRRGSPGASQGLPTAVEPYLGAPSRTMPQPPPYTGSPRYPATMPPAPAPEAAPASKPAAKTPRASGSKPPAASKPPSGGAPAPPASKPAGGSAESKTGTAAATAPSKPTAEQIKQDQLRYEALQKQREEADEAAEKKAQEDRKKAEKEEKEQAKREAEAAKKKAEEDRKRAEAISAAAERLRAAQAAYEAEIKKAQSKPKGGGGLQ
jgi:pilus assembly protein CpaC